MTPSAQPLTRRELITRAATVATATILTPDLLWAGPEAKEPEVTATEDLMREHGVLRRALLVYTESIPKIKADSASLDASALYRTGVLFRDFGENYHEKMLEEQYIFPVVHKGGGEAAKLTEILLAQHQRGREITSYLLAVTKSGRIATANAEPLARSLEAFVLMYRNHAVRENTILFPAWRSTSPTSSSTNSQKWTTHTGFCPDSSRTVPHTATDCLRIYRMVHFAHLPD